MKSNSKKSQHYLQREPFKLHLSKHLISHFENTLESSRKWESKVWNCSSVQLPSIVSYMKWMTQNNSESRSCFRQVQKLLHPRIIINWSNVSWKPDIWRQSGLKKKKKRGEARARPEPKRPALICEDDTTIAEHRCDQWRFDSQENQNFTSK